MLLYIMSIFFLAHLGVLDVYHRHDFVILVTINRYWQYYPKVQLHLNDIRQIARTQDKLNLSFKSCTIIRPSLTCLLFPTLTWPKCSV